MRRSFNHGVRSGISTVADDILIVGRSQIEAEARNGHDRNFANLLRRARSQNLKLNKAKTRLHMNELKYIGHVLSPGGVKADPDKVSDIKNMPTPTDAEQVRRLLGFTNYLAKFFPNLSAISESCTATTHSERRRIRVGVRSTASV